jgi:hypothetical protein
MVNLQKSLLKDIGDADRCRWHIVARQPGRSALLAARRYGRGSSPYRGPRQFQCHLATPLLLMPLQNRVTPFGTIVALPERGLFTGNRGILHDPKTRTLKRRWANKRWLVCLCEFKGRRRTVMGQGSWTELFFLDEATALAAGHRPCFECRREDAEKFRAAWAAGNGGSQPVAKVMDAVLHAERLAGRERRVHALDCPIAELPDGAMIGGGQISFLVFDKKAWRWTPSGYEIAPNGLEGAVLLTPPSTLRSLIAGYRPHLHPSAAALRNHRRERPRFWVQGQNRIIRVVAINDRSAWAAARPHR